LQRKLREFTTEPLAGLHPTQSITLSELGVKTGKNGELSLDTALMDKTIAGRYDIASGVFRNGIVTSSEMIEVVSSGQAKTGYYDIAVTRQPISGYAKTKDLSSLTFPLVTATDMTFKMRVDSVQSGDITLSSGTYDTLSTLKTAFQKAIVSDSVFRGAGIRPTVSISNGALSFQSPSYGTRSHVEFSALNSDLETLLGFSTENGGKNDVGVNIAGTINGETAVGSGRKLIGSTGGKTEGLSILVKLGVDSGSVYFAQSLPDRMKNFIDTFMDTDGSLENRISALTEKKKDLNTELTDLDAEMENIRKRYLKDFVKMDDLVRKLNSTSDLIKSQVKAWNNSSD
jgi:flagellar hook-associated protein 2